MTYFDLFGYGDNQSYGKPFQEKCFIGQLASSSINGGLSQYMMKIKEKNEEPPVCCSINNDVLLLIEE